MNQTENNNDNKRVNIPLDDISVNQSSYVDPNGFLFQYGDDLFRAIKENNKTFYLEMYQNGFMKELTDHYHLVPTETTDYTVNEADCDLVFKHKRIKPLSYCVEWCPSMLKEAALATLRLNIKLLEKNCFLQDAYPWNILFEGTTPVFVDLTSIVPIDANLIWPAYQQFINFFLNPLKLMANKKGDIARLLLTEYIDGIPIHQLAKHLKLSYKLKHPWQSLAAKISTRMAGKIQDNVKLKQKFQDKIKAIKIDNTIRKRFFNNLLKKVEAISVKPGKSTWENYYEAIAPSVEQQKKIEIVGGLLDRVKPATVLDIGCNTGRFSILAAQKGARVTSLDNGADAVECLYREAVEKGHDIHPLVINILNPTPAFGFMSNQFPPLIQRCKSEVVLCLGVMHHLHVNGRQPFDRIAQLLDAVCEKALIFEYVDYKDDNLHLLDHGRPIKYSMEEVSSHLAKYFKIEVFESDRSTRNLLLCTKK
ncbi:MAG: hypothetical protein GY765_15895 [bacterium]|nr:hypothetical protein [bacterium]